MAKVRPEHALLGGVVLAAGLGVFWLARSGKVPAPGLTQFVEDRKSAIQEAVAYPDQLAAPPVYMPIRYPSSVAPQTTQAISKGFAPLYQIPDPQAAALPAEEPW